MRLIKAPDSPPGFGKSRSWAYDFAMGKAAFRKGAFFRGFLLLFWNSVAGHLAAAEADFDTARASMVKEQLAAAGRGITNSRVLSVMGEVPRHEFVPSNYRAQ